MTISQQIENYIAGQPEQKSSDMRKLHEMILELMPTAELWFLDGKNAENKTVANPNIGYGRQTITYADGSTKPFYQIGISANTAGISVYVLGITDKAYLANKFGSALGKASVTGYCIKFKKLQDINMGVLKEAIQSGIAAGIENTG
jgi:uncharacterized protein (TIGR04145 family)